MSSANKPKIYCSTQMEPELVRRLTPQCDLVVAKCPIPTYEETFEDIYGATVYINFGYTATRIDAKLLDRAGPTLKAVCLHSVGHNHVDLAACKERNIKVTYLGNVTAGALAEYTIGLMIAAGRRFKEAIAELPRGGWKNMYINGATSLDYLGGYHLIDSTVGIVGLGNTGQELVKRLQMFNVKKFLYSGPRRKPEGDALGAEYTPFEDLLRNSDFVVPLCTLNESTHHLFNQKAFNLMKPTAVFVNVTRGGIVDQEALVEALTTKKIFAAGLDVAMPEPLPADHPLVALENCVLLPHIGTSVISMRRRTCNFVIDQVLAILEGRPVPLELLP